MISARAFSVPADIVFRNVCFPVICALLLVFSLAAPASARHFSAAATAAQPKPCAILLHGITKDAMSMQAIERALVADGYTTVNLEYPSRENPIEILATEAIPRGLAECEERGASRVHFVAHSMGGLLVRYYFEQRDTSAIASVVMLGTPNQGSRLGNFLSCIPWIKDLNGPAGKQMGIDPRSLPNRLGPVRFPLGVIAGTRSFNPLFAAIIDGDDDGRVGLPSTYVEGTCARVTYPLSHDGLTDDPRVIQQVVHFLDNGTFAGDGVESFPCAESAPD
ncbi:alpha/beta fold hydrolase [Microbulbifer sp. Q7]|uniref:alpha/beta fold hydrolase n=1 Tax=Microbulbifer sp. Q7 TaxID=1785091 RepID=UPI000B31A6B3|nr:alpha/beta fold hydrolase [Microbulbifer sp. Q7]